MAASATAYDNDELIGFLAQGHPVRVIEGFDLVAVVAIGERRRGDPRMLPEIFLELLLGDAVAAQDKGVLGADDEQGFTADHVPVARLDLE